MEKTFEYIKVETALDTFNIEDIGNTILKAANDIGLEWYLSIITENGFTEIKEFGPIIVNCAEITKNGFAYSRHRSEYNEKSLCKTINNFLNDRKREIVQVEALEPYEFEEKLQLVRKII